MRESNLINWIDSYSSEDLILGNCKKTGINHDFSIKKEESFIDGKEEIAFNCDEKKVEAPVRSCPYGGTVCILFAEEIKDQLAERIDTYFKNPETVK